MKKEPVTPLKEKLISYETAKLAKEKGFKNACDWFVNKDNEYIFMPDFMYPNNSEFTYDPENDPEVIEWEEMMKTLFLAPTQSLLQRWLRENYKFNPCIIRVFKNDEFHHWVGFHTLISMDNMYLVSQQKECATYEEALEESLLEALKSIKS